MNALPRQFLKLLLFFALILDGVVQAQENSPSRIGESHAVEKMWQGKSGHIWIYRTDHANRQISLKREGAKGFEIEFIYEGDSSVPVAARIGGRKWHFKKTSLMYQAESRSECGKPGLSNGILPAVYKPTLTPDLALYAQKSKLTEFSRRKTDLLLQDEIDSRYWETYYDFASYIDDVNYGLDQYWDAIVPPMKDPVCVARCDSLYDGWLFVCGAMFDVPPVGIACLLTVVAGKNWCLRKCG